MIREDLASLQALLWKRAYIYTLFHQVFGGEPTDEIVKILASESTAGALEEYAQADETMNKLQVFFRGLSKRVEDSQFLWDIQGEYTRMFIGPGELKAVPWESPYVSNDPVMFQEETLAVREAYRQAGFQVSKLYHVPDDHLSILCAFMAAVSERAISAFQAGNLAELRTCMLDQCIFVRDHLANWLPKYASLACSGKTSHLYPQLAKGVAAFVDLDKVFAAETVAWIDAQDQKADEPVEPDELEAPFNAVFSFALKDSYETLKAIRPKGIEDNELKPI